MKTVQDFFEDPWLKRTGSSRRLPKDVLFACTYDLDIQGPDTIEEACFFRRTETRDELWITGNTLDFGCAYAVPKKDDDLSACLNLLYRLFSDRVGFYWPTGFVAAGIVNESAFNSLVGRLKRELEDNAAKARLKETEIIQVARELGLNPIPVNEFCSPPYMALFGVAISICGHGQDINPVHSRVLGLNPQPTGTGPDYWQATCPRTNHPLYINAAENEFGCGWCRRKGGIEELRAFVKERRER